MFKRDYIYIFGVVMNYNMVCIILPNVALLVFMLALEQPIRLQSTTNPLFIPYN